MNTKAIIQESTPIFLEVRYGNKRTFLAPAKIVHIDASSNYATIHTEDHPPVMVAKVLKKFQQLLEGCGFIRINNSILINTNKVRDIRDGAVIMEDESRFYPSRRRKSELKKLFLVNPHPGC